METYPKVHARVSALGKNETFTVFSVHQKIKTADLKSAGAPGNPSYLLQDVPWADISYLDEPGLDGTNSDESFEQMDRIADAQQNLKNAFAEHECESEDTRQGQ
jgi:hypothetical protein